MGNVGKAIVFSLIIVAVLGALALLPAIEFEQDAIVSSAAWAWIVAAMYFIPTHTVVTILTVIVALGVWSLIVAVVKAMWDILPFAK